MERKPNIILAGFLFVLSMLSAFTTKAAPGGPQAVIYYSDGVKVLKNKIYLQDGTIFSAAQNAVAAPAISNCSLAASVASSALTIALKDGAGADPSAASPCVLSYRNATATTGTVTKSSVAAALSVVVSNGSALGCTATSVCTLHVYGIYTDSATVLGVVNGNMLYEGVVASSTAEGGAGGADTINTLYSTAAQTSKPVKYLGRVTVTPAASFAWTNAPSAIVSGDYPVPKAPTIQTFTSSSGTYTLPTNPKPLYLRVRMVGGGGGGGSSGTSAGTAATAGGNTTFGTALLAANGGGKGYNGIAASASDAGGSASLGTGPIGTSIQGASGGGSSLNAASGAADIAGGMGGVSPFGGAGTGGGEGTAAGGAAVANTGSGGGGARASGILLHYSGSGGSAGGYIDALISAPLATYAYAVGSGGTAGGAGTSGAAGGAGGSGYIEVTEFYQ